MDEFVFCFVVLVVSVMGVFCHPQKPQRCLSFKNYRSLKHPTHSLSLDSNKNSFYNRKEAEWDPGHFPQSEQQTNKSRFA